MHSFFITLVRQLTIPLTLSLKKAVTALTNYFEPKKNVAFEEYQFREAKQNPAEQIMTHNTRLVQLAKTCKFTDTDREIKSQIIQHCTFSKVRRKALSKPTTTLKNILEYGKTLEITEIQAASLERHDINYVHKGQETRPEKSWTGTPTLKDCRPPRNESKSTICGCCSGTYPHKGGQTACPVYKKECHGYWRIGHFKSVYRNTWKQAKSLAQKEAPKKV